MLIYFKQLGGFFPGRRHMARASLLRHLLWTSSAIAIGAGSGGVALACNPSIALSGPASTAGISNDGGIDCVVIADHAVVNGNVVNESTGEIGSASWPPQTGIAVENATIHGAIVNNGVINAGGAAISVTGSSVVTEGIKNEGGATIKATGEGGRAVGIAVSGGKFFGGITNSGTITAIAGPGRAAGIGGPSTDDQRSQAPGQ